MLPSTNLAAADDRALMRLIRGGDGAARAALIERYLPLARRLAIRHRRVNEPLDDLVQVAAIGLIKAVDRWEPERGLAFASYAVPTISGELRHHLRDATWLVRPTRDVIELAARIEPARESLRATLGREPALADLSERLERAPDRVSRALATGDCRWGTSLDVEADEPGAVRELVGGEDSDYELAEARLAFEQLTATLGPRAREVLRLVFVEDLVQLQVAERLGCSQMQVSRIVKASIGELRSQDRLAA